ncbi:MAG: NTP transferase domain-containing protein [Acidimicrobiia bacterium]|nr:NTP transferase domain-containing protein [Acidimicrobiia bacterium]
MTDPNDVSTAAVLLAGGSGSRVQEDINKVYLPLGERQIVSYALEALDRTPGIDLIVIVHRPEDRDMLQAVLATTETGTPIRSVLGGETRHLSEHAALEFLAPYDRFDLVAIHDAARPFATIELVTRLIDKAAGGMGAIPALDPSHPIIGRDGSSIPNGDLVRVQTPQVFPAETLIAAYRAATAAGFGGVDTAETVERYSDLPVEVVEGDPRNIKITFIEDIFEAEMLALDWEAGNWV